MRAGQALPEPLAQPLAPTRRPARTPAVRPVADAARRAQMPLDGLHPSLLRTWERPVLRHGPHAPLERGKARVRPAYERGYTVPRVSTLIDIDVGRRAARRRSSRAVGGAAGHQRDEVGAGRYRRRCLACTGHLPSLTE